MDDAATYAALGWPVEAAADGPLLRTGQVVDVLEVPYAGGLLAAHWWLRSGGFPDQFRGIPALPRPDRALAVAATAASFWFAAQAGVCPWPYGDGHVVRLHAQRSELPAVRWHGPGGKVALPPSPAVAWVHPPGRDYEPPNPLDLVELLTRAVGAIDPGLSALCLNGARVVPASEVDGPELPRVPVLRSPKARTGFCL